MSTPSKSKYTAETIEAKPEPMLSELRYFCNELKQALVNDSGSKNPRDVILNYILKLDNDTISYYFSFLVKNDIQVRISGNLKLTTAKDISAIYLRSYFWQYLRFDKDLKRRFETTIFATSFV